MTNHAVEVNGLWKMFRQYREKNQFLKSAVMSGRRSRYEEFWAVRDVSFDVVTGEAFGIIGSNGSGKSTILKCLAGILSPDRGTVESTGRVAALLELGAGFHPELSGRENISLNGAILGMGSGEIERKLDEIVQFAGLEKFIDSPVKNYSSGMVVRLGFAIAINVEPEILIIDEVLAVGDEEFQQRCFQKIERFRREGRTIIFVSHGLSQVAQFCDRALWLDQGEVKSIGPAYEIVTRYTGAAHHSADDRTDDHEDPESRWGSGEVTITRVMLLDARGSETNVFESGTRFTVRIEFDVRQPIDELVVGLRITHLHGANIFGTNTKRRGILLDHPLGPGVVDFTVDALPILEGTFDLTVDVSDNMEVNPYDHLEKAFRFNVVQTDTFDEGLTRFTGKWTGPQARRGS